MQINKDTPISQICHSDDELMHYGVPGMKWGVRRKLRKQSDFQDSKRKVKKSHQKYMDTENKLYETRWKAESQFDSKRPYNPNMTADQHLEWNVDRYVHVLNKTHKAAQNRDRAKSEYKQILNDTVRKHSDVLVKDVKISDSQRQRIDRVIRDELVKDLLKD